MDESTKKNKRQQKGRKHECDLDALGSFQDHSHEVKLFLPKKMQLPTIFQCRCSVFNLQQ